MCGWQSLKFDDYNDRYGHIYENSTCSNCGSQPRHRSFVFYFQKYVYTDTNINVLHFSPQSRIADLFRANDKINYITSDFKTGGAMIKEDMQNLSYGDRSFDVVICLHVLEHIEDDRKALKEIYRVLKNKGFALIDVPIDNSLEHTYEDPLINTPEARSKAYWQWDHLRLYGRDFSDRLQEAGFKVTKLELKHYIDEDDFRYYGLKRSPIYYCLKHLSVVERIKDYLKKARR